MLALVPWKMTFNKHIHSFYWQLEVGNGWAAAVKDESQRDGDAETTYQIAAVSKGSIVKSDRTFGDFFQAKYEAVQLALSQTPQQPEEK